MIKALLLLDYDDHSPPPLLVIRAVLMRAGYKVVEARKKPSRSGKGWHCLLTLDREVDTAMETVALQAVCGSDQFREACNITRARAVDSLPDGIDKSWLARWNVLYGKGGTDKLCRGENWDSSKD